MSTLLCMNLRDIVGQYVDTITLPDGLVVRQQRQGQSLELFFAQAFNLRRRAEDFTAPVYLDPELGRVLSAVTYPLLAENLLHVCKGSSAPGCISREVWKDEYIFAVVC